VCGGSWKRLRRLNLPLKKKSERAAEQDRADVAEAREVWRGEQAELNVQKLETLQ
jgi:hypothetical protein